MGDRNFKPDSGNDLVLEDAGSTDRLRITDGGSTILYEDGGAAALTIDTDGDVYSTGWTDYSSTTSVSGFSSTVATTVHYKTIGKLLFFQFYINGTSNANNFNFSLPKTAVDEYFRGFPCPLWDNGSITTNGNNDFWEIKNSATVHFKINDNSTGFTASGTKLALGLGWYQFV